MCIIKLCLLCMILRSVEDVRCNLLYIKRKDIIRGMLRKNIGKEVCFYFGQR